MDINELEDEIEYWNNLINKHSENDLYEIAFFKIFVKFEQFIINMFINYTLGESNIKGFIPERKLEFSSLSHLEGVFIIESKKYLIEKPESINQLGKHIFKENNNPFETLFRDPQYMDNIVTMRTIRNYTAHGSDESIKKYRKIICNNGELITPSIFLLKRRNNGRETNYSFYIKLFKGHANIIYNYEKA